MSDRYAGERYNPTLASCGALVLYFDGAALQMKGGRKTYIYPAASGAPSKDGRFNYSRAAQTGGPGGPIPEGTYWINPDELWINRWYRPGSEEAWGKFRIAIHPFTTTETYQRGGFFIHGGKILGSAGCIDLTTHIDAFVADLAAEGAKRKCQIHLTVKYPKASK